MPVTVDMINALVRDMAPVELAEPYDNVGLLAGHPNWSVERVLCALDLTPPVLREAEQIGAQLIVTHHPILFHARKNLREDDPEGALLCALVRSGRALIAAHTNFDAAQPGVNDCLAGELGLDAVRALEHGMRVGSWSGTLEALAAHCERRLGAVVRRYGACGAVERVAVMGGAGSEFWPLALAAGAQVYLTGEVRHHDALAAVQAGLAVLEAGHYHTERISVKGLRNGLQTRINALQYNVRVFESSAASF